MEVRKRLNTAKKQQAVELEERKTSTTAELLSLLDAETEQSTVAKTVQSDDSYSESDTQQVVAMYAHGYSSAVHDQVIVLPTHENRPDFLVQRTMRLDDFITAIESGLFKQDAHDYSPVNASGFSTHQQRDQQADENPVIVYRRS